MNPKLEQLRKRYVNPSPSPDASGVYALGPRSMAVPNLLKSNRRSSTPTSTCTVLSARGQRRSQHSPSRT